MLKTKTPQIANRNLPLWVYTASGRVWALTNPRPHQVYWPDIACSLAKICRFNGHTTVFYSVAQHCCLVSDALPYQHRLYGLLHDAHEAILSDLTSPVKQALEFLDGKQGFDYLVAVTDRAVFTAAGLPIPIPEDTAQAVHHMDRVLLATEKRDLLVANDFASSSLVQPLSDPIQPWPWEKAAQEWLSRLKTLCPDLLSEENKPEPEKPSLKTDKAKGMLS